MPLEVDAKVKISNYRESDLGVRKPVQVSLGCHVEGIALPHVDPDDSRTVKDGVKKRFACKMPPPMRSVKRRAFRRFVERWIRKNLLPLAADCDTSVETWLEGTAYPKWRKEELLRKYYSMVTFEDRFLFIKSFIKDELYEEYKHARVINSRTDEYKCLVGPIFKLIEKQLFALGFFIKKIPVRDRPQYIIDNIEQDGATYMSTDFTSYEAHFMEMMDDCERVLYEYMVKDLPEGGHFMQLLEISIFSFNHCIFKYLNVDVWRRRMSGEMNTSLGNGFTNLMLILFLFNSSGLPAPKVIVEGDDGLTSFVGKRPSDEYIQELGLKLKLVESTEVNLASFCGQVFDREDKMVVTDPCAAIVTFGWTTHQYAKSKESVLKGLLRSKAYSMIYSYPGCPILSALGRYGLRVTEGVKAKFGQQNEYEREEYQVLMKSINANSLEQVEIPPNTRKLVAELYNISIEKQLATEKYLDSLNVITPLILIELSSQFPKVWSHYWEHYSMSTSPKFALSTLFPNNVTAGATFPLESG